MNKLLLLCFTFLMGVSFAQSSNFIVSGKLQNGSNVNYSIYDVDGDGYYENGESVQHNEIRTLDTATTRILEERLRKIKEKDERGEYDFEMNWK